MTRLVAAAAGVLACLASSAAWALGPLIVFFASGSAELDDQSRAIIANAAQGIRTLDARQVRVVGGADRRGSAAHNLALSRRRAEAVKAALIAQGIPEASITVEAQGEDRPLVETQDGIAEPQNRFVWIVMDRVCRPYPAHTPLPDC